MTIRSGSVDASLASRDAVASPFCPLREASHGEDASTEYLTASLTAGVPAAGLFHPPCPLCRPCLPLRHLDVVDTDTPSTPCQKKRLVCGSPTSGPAPIGMTVRGSRRAGFPGTYTLVPPLLPPTGCPPIPACEQHYWLKDSCARCREVRQGAAPASATPPGAGAGDAEPGTRSNLPPEANAILGWPVPPVKVYSRVWVSLVLLLRDFAEYTLGKTGSSWFDG